MDWPGCLGAPRPGSPAAHGSGATLGREGFWVRRSLLFLLAALTAIVAGCGGSSDRASVERARAPSHDPRKLHAKPKPSGPFAHPLGRPHLAPGSDPSVLPA